MMICKIMIAEIKGNDLTHVIRIIATSFIPLKKLFNISIVCICFPPFKKILLLIYHIYSPINRTESRGKKMIAEGMQIVGIKQAKSKKTDKVYTTYYGMTPFSDYELENCETEGCAVEQVTTSEKFDINIGDIVEFNYGKAIGDYQPVKSFTLIAANPVKDKPVNK